MAKKKSRYSLSIIVPAFNEERNLKDTVNTVKKAVNGLIDEYEIIIVNDGSSDKTAEIADKLKKDDNRIKVFHSKTNKGMGFSYKKGLELATKDYVTRVPGDNEIKEESIRALIKHAGEADLIITYIENKKVRPLYRRVISGAFTGATNFLFGQNINYYLGLNLCRRKLLKNIKMTTNSCALFAEIIIQFLHQGYTYKEVPMQMHKKQMSINIFMPHNVFGVIKTVAKLFVRYKILERF
ncbi:glycosyltransferase family 2 protein [Candidatus Woesearchaeota archaeon]|nr:glycosyltransferase family 2 protein [Candidatus Woesearchaeota archaeon]